MLPNPLTVLQFDYVFTYEGPNRALIGFMNAISLVMETGFAITAFLALFLNLFLPEEIEDEAVDIDAKDGGAVASGVEPRGEAKTVASSSRGSDVESDDKIQQMQAKEVSP